MRQVTVEYGQHLVDIAVQEFGTADALKVICELNDLEYDADLQAGQVLSLPDLDPDNDIQQYYQDNNIRVNSHLMPGDMEVLSTNDEEGITDNKGGLIGV